MKHKSMINKRQSMCLCVRVSDQKQSIYSTHGFEICFINNPIPEDVHPVTKFFNFTFM